MNFELAKQLKGKHPRYEYHKARYIKDRDKVIEKSRIWQKTNPEKAKAQKIRANRKLRELALDYYGRKCACCGENIYEFLSIDHIGGGGNKHRREVVGHTNIYQWLKSNNYPEGFQTLCHNCNMAKGFYGSCPHNEL